MVFSKIHSAQPNLLRADRVDVEIDLSRGLHSFSIIGLPDKSIEESRGRVSSAIKNSGFISPKQKNHKITISLTPANTKKSGSIFDLPIAIGYLKSSKQIKINTEDKLFIGELSLNGNIRGVTGIIQILMFAKENNFKEVYIPYENKFEASIISGIKIYTIKNLIDLAKHLEGKHTLKHLIHREIKFKTKIEYDFEDIKDNTEAKRALLIAASGGHNICLYGPPGTGKTILSKSFCSILPSLDYKDSVEVSSIHSITIGNNKVITSPPFRNPHHTSSYSSVIGGGSEIKPGEITLAHKGVLFMDEFPEFDNRVINSLRQPLEEKNIRISRSSKTITYPSDFILVLALNPCPCGFFKNDKHHCKCSSREIENYKKKISGPIQDRIDIFTEVSKIDYKKLINKTKETSSIEIRKIVKETRKIQKKRFNKLNNDLSNKDLEKDISDTKMISKLNKIAEKLNISTRSYYKILKVSRTIADLEKSEKIKMPHILEALQYRNKLNY